MADTGYSYIGREPCGCVTCATVDDEDHKKDIAKDIARWVRWGLTIERVPHEYVRQHLASCKCKKVTKPEQTKLFS
jgi:hypothetical protein